MSEKITKKTENKIDYISKWKEARESIALQLKDHLEKVEYHKTMATKAQGAIEVYDQLFDKKDNSES